MFGSYDMEDSHRSLSQGHVGVYHFAGMCIVWLIAVSAGMCIVWLIAVSAFVYILVLVCFYMRFCMCVCMCLCMHVLAHVGLCVMRVWGGCRWPEKAVKQTPWERFAQSKGIGKHKKTESPSSSAPTNSRPRKLRGCVRVCVCVCVYFVMCVCSVFGVCLVCGCGCGCLRMLCSVY